MYETSRKLPIWRGGGRARKTDAGGRLASRACYGMSWIGRRQARRLVARRQGNQTWRPVAQDDGASRPERRAGRFWLPKHDSCPDLIVSEVQARQGDVRQKCLADAIDFVPCQVELCRERDCEHVSRRHGATSASLLATCLTKRRRPGTRVNHQTLARRAFQSQHILQALDLRYLVVIEPERLHVDEPLQASGLGDFI